MKLRDWYTANESIIGFNDVIIQCKRTDSYHVSDVLFKGLLNWKDAIKLFGDYNLQQIQQGFYIGQDNRHEIYRTIQCDIYPDLDEEE